jgi:hypothetical protein
VIALLAAGIKLGNYSYIVVNEILFANLKPIEFRSNYFLVVFSAFRMTNNLVCFSSV